MKMQSKEQNKDQLDDFSKILNEKLKYHKIPVDDQCWKNINRRVQHKKRSAIWWIASAAAIIALYIIVVPTKDNTTRISDSQKIQQKEQHPVTQKDRSDRDSTDNIQMIINPQNIKRKSNYVVVKKLNNPTNVSKMTTDSLSNVINQNINHTFAHGNNEKSNENNTNASNKDSIKILIDNIFEKPQNEFIVEIEKKKNNNWLLAASVSSGSQQSNQTNNRDRLYMNNLPVMNLATQSLKSEVENSNILEAEDFSEINHLPPLSFGLTFRKNLSNRVGIETGLVYTYLSSRFEKNDVPKAKAKQELHYLGLPINLVVYIWDNPRWNVYITSGGMVEKGLSQSFKQDIYKNDTQISSDLKKSSIDGLQWSVNTSAGISYKITNSWNFYFEPRYSYSFDNDQPISIRTEHKHSIGVLGGLRYVLP